MRIVPSIITAALLSAAVPAAATAHVTIAPATTAPGYVVEALRVPNEKDAATTTKLDVRLPAGFASARPAVVPGWSSKITTAKLAKPIQTDDGPIDEGVSQITWTADSKASAIPVGEYQDFPVQLLISQAAGTKLSFKALQTYSNGDVVRWIGAPDADEPAAVLSVVAAAAKAPAKAAAAAAPTVTAGDDGDGPLPVIALVLAALALLIAVATTLRTHRTKGPT